MKAREQIIAAITKHGPMRSEQLTELVNAPHLSTYLGQGYQAGWLTRTGTRRNYVYDLPAPIATQAAKKTPAPARPPNDGTADHLTTPAEATLTFGELHGGGVLLLWPDLTYFRLTDAQVRALAEYERQRRTT